MSKLVRRNCGKINSETMTDKQNPIDEILKSAKAIFTFPGHRKPKNLQYVTTIEEDKAALLDTFERMMGEVKPKEKQTYSDWDNEHYKDGFNDGIAKYSQALHDLLQRLRK